MFRRTPSAKTLTVERSFAAPPSVVFDAWTEAPRLRAWMHPFEMETPEAVVLSVTGAAIDPEAETDLRIGGWFRVLTRGREGEWAITGEYLEVDRPRLLAFTWETPLTFGRPTLVTLFLSETGSGGTRQELVHERLHNDLSVLRHETAWGDLLDKLDGYLRLQF